MLDSVLITGANTGLGKEAARQLAERGVGRVILACRNPEKAAAAKSDLEASTGKSVFEVLLVDVSKPESVRAAVQNLEGTIEGLVMNAGGMGGADPAGRAASGVSNIFAVNVLGHAILAEELLEQKKLTKVVLYAGSEASRGIPRMGMKRPQLADSSVGDFQQIATGEGMPKYDDPMTSYGPVKYVAAMWMGALARAYPEVRVLTVSPGGTSGTEVMRDLKGVQKFFFTYIGVPFLMPMMKMMHSIEKGAERYVDALLDPNYKTGTFYASRPPIITGQMVDQSEVFADLSNQQFQDNARTAVRSFFAA